MENPLDCEKYSRVSREVYLLLFVETTNTMICLFIIVQFYCMIIDICTKYEQRGDSFFAYLALTAAEQHLAEEQNHFIFCHHIISFQ